MPRGGSPSPPKPALPENLAVLAALAVLEYLENLDQLEQLEYLEQLAPPSEKPPLPRNRPKNLPSDNQPLTAASENFSKISSQKVWSYRKVAVLLHSLNGTSGTPLPRKQAFNKLITYH